MSAVDRGVFSYLDSGWSSLCGTRPSNEDAVIHFPQWGLFGVCDGMGGLARGGEASRIVVEQIRREFTDAPFKETLRGLAYRTVAVSTAIRRAADEMHARTRSLNLKGMGSTVAIVAMPAEHEGRGAVLLHIGDSLVLRQREATVKCLYLPHTVEAQLGRAARILPAGYRRAVTRAVDHRRDAQMQVTHVEIQAGDVLAVCTDGVTGVLEIEGVGQQLFDGQADPAQRLAETLTSAAIDAGGHDNASAVIIRVPR